MHAPCLSFRCPLAWDALAGDGAVRRCDRCDRPVYDLSALGPSRAAELLGRAVSERICVRFRHNVTGGLLFAAILATVADTRSAQAEPPRGAEPSELWGKKQEGAIPPIGEGEAVMGELDRSVLARPFQAAGPTLSEAWRAAAAYAAGRSGSVVVRLTVSPTGGVTTAEVQRSELADAPFEAALLDIVRGLVFPAPGGQVLVTYPFQFGAPVPAPAGPAP